MNETDSPYSHGAYSWGMEIKLYEEVRDALRVNEG